MKGLFWVHHSKTQSAAELKTGTDVLGEIDYTPLYNLSSVEGLICGEEEYCDIDFSKMAGHWKIFQRWNLQKQY